jgi:SIR2-like domain
VNAEQAEWGAGNFDRVLNLLEGRFSRALVRRAAIRTLATPPGAALQTHQAIIDLARDRDSRLHLVTTNFDLLFQAAGAAVSAVYSGPELPILKRPRWNGLVHLHGRIRDDDADGDRLVLTSADFGLAYLMERWASRFVLEFNNFTVIFIGYSVDDPVMRYLVDALAAET